MTKGRLRALESSVSIVLHTKTLSPDLTVPGGRQHVDLVRRLLAEAVSQGAEHAGKARITRQDRFAARIIDEAVAWMNSRAALAGKWNRDLDGAVVQVLNNALATGASLRDTMSALKVVFVNFSDSRLKAIARTEATAAFNEGLLLVWKDEEEVVGYQWQAVLDHRTCPLCSSRDGMIILKGNPALGRMLPPVHVNCRCFLVPITRAEYEALKSEQPELFEEAEARIFERGEGPQTLEEALDWSDVPPPSPGFGGTSGQDYRRQPSRSTAPAPGAQKPNAQGPVVPLTVAEVGEIQKRASTVETEQDSAAFLLWLLLLLKRHREQPVADEDEEGVGEEG